MSPTLLWTMISCALGFMCMAGAYASFVAKKPRAVSITLIVLAFLFLTIIPTAAAIFLASTDS